MKMTDLEKLEQAADDLTGAADDLHEVLVTLGHTPIADYDLLDMVKQAYEAASEKLRLVLEELEVRRQIQEREEMAYQNYEYERSVI